MRDRALQRAEYRVAPRIEEVESAISAILDQARYWGMDDEKAIFDLHLAVEEALANAMFHGVLEIEPQYRERGVAELLAECKARVTRQPYANRHIGVVAELLQHAVRITINDGGHGFDPSRIPAEADTCSVGGRGLMLIRSFVDEVRHNAAGNEITLLKRFPAPEDQTA